MTVFSDTALELGSLIMAVL